MNLEEYSSKTEYEKAVACEMFDVYCKQILSQVLADYLRRKNFLNEHEIPTTDMDFCGIRYTIQIGSRDTYLFDEDGRWFVEHRTEGDFSETARILLP